MKLSGRNQVVTDRSLFEVMKEFKKAGYDGMELSILRGMNNIIAWEYLDNDVIQIINARASELELPVMALACHQNYVTDDLVFQAQKMLLQKAQKYQTDIVIMATPVDLRLRENNETVLYRELECRTRELCRIAEANGVNIAIEIEPNHLFRNVDIFLDLADKINSPSLKVNFDVGHIYLTEPDLLKAIEKLERFTVHSHIDNMCRGEHCHKLPWEGEIDLTAVYKKLKEYGFDGDVSLDLYLQDYLKVSPECVMYIKNTVFEETRDSAEQGGSAQP